MGKIFLSYFLYFYYVLLVKTVRMRLTGFDALRAEIKAGLTPVIGCTHGSMLGCLISCDEIPGAIMASLSKDGELISALLGRRGFHMVRGSSSKGGKAALIELLTTLKPGRSIGITFDGPRGPALKPKAGIAICALNATGSMFFIQTLPESRYLWKKLRSWDRFHLLFPFCKLRIACEKIQIEHVSKSNPEEWIAEFLLKLEQRAQEVYGKFYERA